MKKIETSALIGLGALGILFGRKMPGVQVIADEARIARYAAEPVVCNGEECKFSYVTPAEGKPVDLLLVAVKATVLEQAIQGANVAVNTDASRMGQCKVRRAGHRDPQRAERHHQRGAH